MTEAIRVSVSLNIGDMIAGVLIFSGLIVLANSIRELK